METRTNAKVFDDIYTYNKWIFGSGTGSVAFFNKPYLSFINSFLKQYPDIKTVVDIGCGDWQIGKHLALGDRTYIGGDVSNVIIEKSREKYGSEKVTFVHLDAVTDELPEGDLVIIKDVLQHLPTEDVERVLKKLEKYQYVVTQNDIFENQKNNSDINSGQFRPLDVTKEPFNRSGYILTKVYTEGLRKPLNLLRTIMGLKPIKKGIFVKIS